MVFNELADEKANEAREKFVFYYNSKINNPSSINYEKAKVGRALGYS